MLILLAEDNPGDVLLVHAALEEHRIAHELRVVQDGEQAISLFARIGEPDNLPCPDLLLLDLNLPKVDGLEVLAEFRKHPECAETPVLVLSSSDMPKERKRMAELKVTHYFQKPSNLDAFMELGSVVQTIIKKRFGHQSH